MLSIFWWSGNCSAKGDLEVKGHPEFSVLADFLLAIPRVGFEPILERMKGPWAFCLPTVVGLF